MRLTVDPLGQPTVARSPPWWPHAWDMAVRTMRMASRGQRAGWPGAEHPVATARAAQVKQLAGNNKDCGVCALMSAIGNLLRVPRPDNLLSTLDRRWVAAVALNRDMGPIARLPSLGGLPAAVPEPLPAPRTPLEVADIPHHVGLPEARMRHALLCMTAADGGMSMLMTVSVQHVKDARQQQRLHAPQSWEENARRWLHVEGLTPPIRWAQRTRESCCCWKGRSIGSVFGWTKGVQNGLSLPRAGSEGSSLGARPATRCSGNASGPWAQCAGCTGARPGTYRRRRLCSWK